MKLTSRSVRHPLRPRRGVLSLELAMTLPILGLVLLGLFEFSMLFFARGQVVEASRLGARKASLPGATEADVEDEIRRVLSPALQESLQIDVELGERSGDLVAVAVHVPMHCAAPDLLWPIGFSLEGRDVSAETRMVKE